LPTLLEGVVHQSNWGEAMNSDFDAKWQELAEEVMSGMKEWRLQHPKAALREIERALDERLAKMRARMLQDAALASAAADMQANEEEERPVCPECGARLESRGKQERHVTTLHNQELRLEATECVPPAEQAFFPLDEELELLPGQLTPNLQEDLVHLGTWMPFGRAAKELEHFRGVDVSRPTAERLTEAAGSAYVARQTAEVERIEKELPASPTGPERQFLSVDGAMVPLVGGDWAEAKTLVLGEVQPSVEVKGEQVVRTDKLSYFSRLTDSDTFQRLSLVETHRRGVETAGAVAAVTDGSDWIQGFIDFHRPDAVRILDFPRAAEHLYAVGQAILGEGTSQAQSWLADQLHQLKHTGPASVLAKVRQLVTARPDLPDLSKQPAYLEKRVALLEYPQFQAAGWPIGDGAVESANKLVVESRLTGSGMHWARDHVDPMVALRNIACNDRWAEAWPQIVGTPRQQERQRRAQRRHQRKASASRSSVTPMEAVTPDSACEETPPVARPQHSKSKSPKKTAPKQPRRPAANHPWRRMPIGRARFEPATVETDAKS
jgi:hypothetical protein